MEFSDHQRQEALDWALQYLYDTYPEEEIKMSHIIDLSKAYLAGVEITEERLKGTDDARKN